MFHHPSIDAYRMQMVFFELGDTMRKYEVHDLMQFYNDNLEVISTWQQFMVVIDHIKRQHQRPKGIFGMRKRKTGGVFCCCKRNRVRKAGAVRNGWAKEWDAVASRYRYRHTISNARSWDIPEEYRVYLPPKVEEQLLTRFDYDVIDAIKARFIWADTNLSGGLTADSFAKLAVAMRVTKSEHEARSRLFRKLDWNQNGLMEFHELCQFIFKLVPPPTQRSRYWRHFAAFEDILFTADVGMPLYYLSNYFTDVDNDFEEGNSSVITRFRFLNGNRSQTSRSISSMATKIKGKQPLAVNPVTSIRTVLAMLNRNQSNNAVGVEDPGVADPEEQGHELEHSPPDLDQLRESTSFVQDLTSTGFGAEDAEDQKSVGSSSLQTEERPKRRKRKPMNMQEDDTHGLGCMCSCRGLSLAGAVGVLLD